jgi:hypothetical protein
MKGTKLDYTMAIGDIACQDPVTAAPEGTKVCGKFYIPKEYACGATEGFANYSPTEFSSYALLTLSQPLRYTNNSYIYSTL